MYTFSSSLQVVLFEVNPFNFLIVKYSIIAL
jgi:hypothetical protein